MQTISRKKTTAALTLALILAACGDKAPVTQEQMAERAADIVKPDPGLYRTSAEMVEIDIPNATQQMKDAMKAGSAKAGTQEFCLTRADADKGFEEAIKRSQQGDCTYKKFDVAGGRIDADMTCTNQGATVDMAMDGTVSRTGSDLTIALEMDMPGVGKSTIKTRAKTERIGDCPAA